MQFFGWGGRGWLKVQDQTLIPATARADRGYEPSASTVQFHTPPNTTGVKSFFQCPSTAPSNKDQQVRGELGTSRINFWLGQSLLLSSTSELIFKAYILLLHSSFFRAFCILKSAFFCDEIYLGKKQTELPRRAANGRSLSGHKHGLLTSAWLNKGEDHQGFPSQFISNVPEVHQPTRVESSSSSLLRLETAYSFLFHRDGTKMSIASSKQKLKQSKSIWLEGSELEFPFSMQAEHCWWRNSRQGNR